MFTQSAFFQSAVNSIGETAIAYSLTVARWAVLGYDAAYTARAWYLQTFFSQEAQARYEEVGESIGLVLVALYQGWMTTCEVIDEHVQACEVKRLTQALETEEIVIDDLVIDDYMDDEETYAESISHEDYLDRKIQLEDMTLKALIPIAQDLNIATRKVRKEVLVEAILKAEGYEA
jgi:hypothetical protein